MAINQYGIYLQRQVTLNLYSMPCTACLERAFQIERLDFTQKIILVESGINRSIFIYCLAANVSFSDPQRTQSREELKCFQRP